MQENQQGTLSDIRKQLVFDAPIEKVWKAVATSDGIAAWFMPNNFQPILGYEFVLNAGNFGDSPCKVTVLEPPHRLSFTWGKDWTLSFELKDLDGKTEFTLIHSGWDADKVTEFGESHVVIRGRMDAGWGQLVEKLRNQIEA
ncbi:SRPBCC family protein [Tumebacillus lipolyticus]|uniref:SRPBCC domain-containing protein n=1 Tax=Tumebacillus lipolyticus TaxID=1280370 RepID=A0ABW4ZZN5_9BACL